MQRSARTLSSVLQRSCALGAQRSSIVGWKCLAPTTQTDGSFKPVLSVQQLRFYTDQQVPPKFEKEDRAAFTIHNIEDFKTLIEKNKIYLFDVREPSEVAQGRPPAKRYLNLPIGQVVSCMRLSPEEFKEKYGAEKPNKHDSEIVTMCLAGVRSTWALQAFHEFGFVKARHFPGGWAAWNKAYPHYHRKE